MTSASTTRPADDGPPPPSSTAAISVVIPAFDRGDTIEATIGSIRAAADRLGSPHTEIIVVDDGSHDDTAERVAAIQPHDIRLLLVSQPHLGVSAARNAGARAANRPYLAFVDADDEVGIDWLLAFHRTARQAKGPDLVFGSARLVGPGARAASERRRWDPEPLGPAFGDLVGRFNPGVFTVRRDRFLACGGYATDLAFSEGTDLGLRLVRTALDQDRPLTAATTRPPDQVPGPSSRVVLDAGIDAIITMPAGPGHSNAYSDENRYASARHLLAAHGDHLARTDPVLAGTYWAIAGVAAARLGRDDEARRCFRQAVAIRPQLDRHTARHALRLSTATIGPLRRRRWPTGGADESVRRPADER